MELGTFDCKCFAILLPGNFGLYCIRISRSLPLSINTHWKYFFSIDFELALLYALRSVWVIRKIYWGLSWQELVKGMKFCYIYKQRGLLPIASCLMLWELWLLMVEDMSFLDQRQKKLLLKGTIDARVSAFILVLKSWTSTSDSKRPCDAWYIAARYKRGPLSLEISDFFLRVIMSAWLLHWRETLLY